MSNQPSTPYSLLVRLVAVPRDDRAWAEFVDIYGPVILRWCHRSGVQASDAEDVAQEVLAKLCKGLQNYRRETGLFRKYLGTIAHNEVMRFSEKLARRRDRGRGGESENSLSNHPDPATLEADLLSAFDRDLLESAWERTAGKVNANHLEVFRQLVQGNASSAEAAQQFGLTIQTVYKIRLKVKKIFQEELQRLQEEGPGPASA